MFIHGDVVMFFKQIKRRSILVCTTCEHKIADARVPAGIQYDAAMKDLELYCKNCEKYSLFAVEKVNIYD
jgi:ribosomal protein L44E